jgi:proline dehydrogenase
VALLDRAFVRLLPGVPRPVVQKLSVRYIAGPELLDACRVIRAENAAGKSATLDVLGESIEVLEEARSVVAEYRQSLETIEREALDANISIKPTAVGLDLGYDVCRAHVDELAAVARRSDNFVRIEMEDSSRTDATLRLYRELRAGGVENVGIVLQAQLRRTAHDVRDLAALRPNVRLVKGIYVEPAELAFHDHDAIRVSYARLLESLLDDGCYVALATHDEWLVNEGRRLVEERGLGRDEYEFQLLLGVRRELGEALVAEGHRVRTYVPYGRRWYEYSLRRLQENPKLAGYIATDAVGRLRPFGARPAPRWLEP